MDSTVRRILVFFFFVTVFFLLRLMAGILIPLALALLFAVMLQPIVLWLRRRGVPSWLVLPIISVGTLLIMFVISGVFIKTVTDVLARQDQLIGSLRGKLEHMLIGMNDMGISVDRQYLITALKNTVNRDLITAVAGSTARGVGSFSGSFFMFALYFIILLSGMSQYRRYITWVAGKDDADGVMKSYEVLQSSMASYIGVKTVISLVTGTAAGLICVALGIEFALFWGLFAFLLNFIPSVGSIIATIPPVLMAVIQFDDFWSALLVLLLLGGVQVIMGNVVEPRIMGEKLRLNTITVIFGLVFWGYIWGMPGMLLSVPLLVVMKLVLEQYGEFNHIARMMSYPETEKSHMKD